MPPKKVDPRVAKEKRQKKIAAVGGVLLVVVLVVQVPRTMKMLGDDSAEPVPAAEAAVPATPAAPAPGAAPLEPPTLSGGQPAGPAPAAAPPRAEPSAKLISFSRFATKDPFAPQVSQGAAAPAAESPTEATGGEKAEAPGGEPAKPGASAPEGAPEGAPTRAELVVNGGAETVALDGTFPASTKAFVLTALSPKSATVGVAEGGSFASGGTLEIAVGETVTLVNTADGTRYVVELRAVS